MKNYNPDTDDIYYVFNIKDSTGLSLLVSDLTAFKIKAFTNDEVNNFVELTAEDVIDDQLYIPTGRLSELNPGPLRFRFFIGVEDERYPDSVYNTTHLKLTGYYVKKTKQSR